MIEQENDEYHRNRAEYYNECNKVIDMINVVRKSNENDISINVICPTCKASKNFSLSTTSLKSGKLTTISMPSGFACEHTFQAFIDSQFKVRGYQKVDVDLASNLKEDNKNSNLDIDTKIDIFKPDNKAFNDNLKKKNGGNLDELYEKFWEFIDEDNQTFREQIMNDKRRRLGHI